MTRPDRPSAKPAILVVDHPPDICALACDLLVVGGYRAVAAPSHTTALAALRAVRFALVLADPAGAAGGGDHWAGLDRLLAAAGDTPVVICSAHDPARFVGHAARGFAGLLAKPFALDELLATVARFAERAGYPEPRQHAGVAFAEASER